MVYSSTLVPKGSFCWKSWLHNFCCCHISKAFNRALHKSLLSKLLSYEFYPSLCCFISSFPSGRSIFALVNGHCSYPGLINSGVPQGHFFYLIDFHWSIRIYRIMTVLSIPSAMTILCISQHHFPDDHHSRSYISQEKMLQSPFSSELYFRTQQKALIVEGFRNLFFFSPVKYTQPSMQLFSTLR